MKEMNEVKETKKVKEVKEIQPMNYDKLISKLVDLCGYNKVFHDFKGLYDFEVKFPEFYRKTRSEVTGLLEKEYSEILNIFQLLLSSGMIRMTHGNIYEEDLIEFKPRSIHFLDSGFIELEVGDIVCMSRNIPSDFLEWFSGRGDFIPLKQNKDMEDKTVFDQQDITN